MRHVTSLLMPLLVLSMSTLSAQALTDGSISGSVQDNQGIALPNTSVELVTPDGVVLKRAETTMTGDYQFNLVTFGDYKIKVQVQGFAPSQTSVHVTAGSNSVLDVKLEQPVQGQEMVLEVKAKRHVIKNTASTSSTELTKDQITQLPGGNDVSLPKLIESTTPGVVQGPFNQTFIRGNHADVQYEIDGVQLPDSTSGSFSEAFAVRNIDHMDVITGGLPAEYGERLAAVVNITTKTGPEKPGGEAEVNYGTYDTFAPHIIYGGSNEKGDIHYFFSGSYVRTDRGIDTPNPQDTTPNGQQQGGDPSHDFSNGNNQFAKLDWLPTNEDKVSFIFFQNYNFYQIPTYPSSFNPQDPYFSANPAAPYTDAFGNTNTPVAGNAITPLFNFTPPGTDDTQANQDLYGQAVWKHTYNERTFLQVAPYWKYSKVKVTNDPTNDLSSATTGSSDFIANSTPSSFSLDRHVNNIGLKTDYSTRPDDRNLVKAGFQLQYSVANDSLAIESRSNGVDTSDFSDGSEDQGYFEAAYVQDDLQMGKHWSLNGGLRFTATQFHFVDADSSALQFQPRIGVNYMPTDQTKIHAYYGRLFQPAPLEDLRTAFNAVNGGTTATFFDVKPEKDNYFEVGIDQGFAETQVVTVNAYYKQATDMLDDTQLLNTSIATPYNYTKGYAYGVEFTVKGKLNSDFSDYFNYSYEIAKGQGIDGGTFAVPANSIPQDTYLFLDHVQIHTANAGLTYAKDQYFSTVQGLFGSGLRTGPNNSLHLPSHFSFDLTGGYEFGRGSDEFWRKWKLAGDIVNIFNNAYPISIANGFNGSHYEAGRQFFVRLSKEI